MKKLTLVDGNSLLFRAYYATAYPGAKLLQTSTGIYTNAVFAFTNMLEKIIEQSGDHILIAFDTGKPTHRHETYENYKAGRKAMPEELASQIPLIHELIALLGIKDFSFDGYEADDIIGTLAKNASKLDYKVDVYSSDRDLLQLVEENITVHMLKQGMKVVETYTPETLLERYGLTHHQFVDLKALMGDQSDNIPGVPGIGEKTGVTLLQKYGSLENIIQSKEEIKGKLGENIRANVEQALFSKKLSTIMIDCTLPFEVSDTLLINTNKEDLINFFRRLELRQLVISFKKKYDLQQTQTSQITKTENLLKTDDEPRDLFSQEVISKEDEVKKTFNYEVIETESKLESILNEDLTLYFEFSTFNYHKATLWGVGIANKENNYFISSDLALSSNAFKNYLVNENYKKYTYNYKAVLVFLKWNNLDILNVTYDLLLAAYVLKSSVGKEDFTYIAQSFDITDVSYDEEIYGKGVKKGLPLIVSDYEAHIAKKAYVTEILRSITLKNLEERGQLHLLNEIEIPLSKVIANMEFEGLYVDKKELQSQTENLSGRIEILKKDILELAGVDFNIDSPKQLGDVLFETLGLPNGKKTKTGYSTDVEVLTYLYDRHPIIPKVMEYRQLTKLFSTYLVGIKEAIFSDNKVHTIFNQALTLTGRLSSLEPNLQNIPIRTEEGRLVRKVFVASKNNTLLGADYSQIELRVLADMADVKNLQEAFKNHEDIHSSTAKKVFHVEEVDTEQRRKAKAVNFGIIYGIGAWSLSEDINVTVKEAEEFIKRYLEVYPEIKTYMTDIVEFAKTHGYVETILKRRRYIPELESKVFQLREFGKRTSMNAPVQGSAADIIKVAMIKLYDYLTVNNKKSKLILQVHDELILDCVEEELNEMKEIVPKIMKEAVKLKVDLETSCDTGLTWYDLK